MYLSTGLKAQMQRKMIVGSLLDKIPAPGLRRSSSRSSSREPRFVDRPRKWTAPPSGECRARSPWFRSCPIRSHLFFPLKKSLCNNDPQGLLFAANKEPPCQQFLRLLYLRMKKHENHWLKSSELFNPDSPTENADTDETWWNKWRFVNTNECLKLPRASSRPQA